MTPSEDRVLNKLREEIANCPFCRGSGEIWVGWARVRCEGCGTLGPPRASLDEAIAAWNRRADPLVEELRGALEPFAISKDPFPGEDFPVVLVRYERAGSTNIPGPMWSAFRRAREALALPVGGGSSREPALSDDGGDDSSLRSDATETWRLLASIWFYGGFVAETHNERRLQAVMERRGCWPIKTEAALFRVLDGSAPRNPAQAPEVSSGPELIAAVAAAMDHQFGWSINLSRLVDGESTYTLTFPGYEPAEFSYHEDAHEELAKRLSVERAKLVLAALAQPDPLTETSGRVDGGDRG